MTEAGEETEELQFDFGVTIRRKEGKAKCTKAKYMEFTLSRPGGSADKVQSLSFLGL